MSRLGRDYLQVGMYTEVIFPEADVKFIAVNNDVDSENDDDNEFTPFLNIINEWYAKDTSKKIRSVMKSKGQSGKPLSTNPPYRYVKNPNNNEEWIVDNEAAEVVRLIFKLCIEGLGVTQIAKELEYREILTPVHYFASKSIKIPAKGNKSPYHWEASTVARILERQEYVDDTVNFKTYRKTFKNKKQCFNDKSDWQIFKGTHEAIIDKETFGIVQNIRNATKRQRTPMGELPMLSGLLYCPECGKRLSQVCCADWDYDKYYFACSAYRKVKGGCNSHRINNVPMEKILLDSIRDITSFAMENESEFVALVESKIKKLNLMQKLYVYQAEKKDGFKYQKIRIVWNCIGEVELPKDINLGIAN